LQGPGREFWIASAAGIFRVDQAGLEACLDGTAERVHPVPYGREEGLPSLSCAEAVQPAAIHRSNGEMTFATSFGAVTLSPRLVATRQTDIPTIIEECFADDRPLPLHEPVRIPAGTRELRFRYGGINFSRPELTRFRTRVVGHSEQWQERGGEHALSLGRLPPGDYRLEVAAAEAHQPWSARPASLAFFVAPAFWQHAAFRAAGLVAAGAGALGLLRWRAARRMRRRMQHLESESVLQRERARIARDMHDEMGARLTEIMILSELARKEVQAQGSVCPPPVQKLQQVARNAVCAMDEIVWALNPRHDTLPNTLEYLAEFATEFLGTAGIRCRQDFPAAPADLPLSGDFRHGLFLVVKEALNNIVKHAAASEATIRATVAGRELQMVVEDNGRGLPETIASALSSGLINIRERLRELHGTCEVSSRAGEGTRLVMHFRLPAAEKNPS
jgi:signal transduction histidine kinase